MLAESRTRAAEQLIDRPTNQPTYYILHCLHNIISRAY
jgi:hypothetical protein